MSEGLQYWGQLPQHNNNMNDESSITLTAFAYNGEVYISVNELILEITRVEHRLTVNGLLQAIVEIKQKAELQLEKMKDNDKV